MALRGDTAFSARFDGAFEASLVSTGRVLWSTRVKQSGITWTPLSIALARDLVLVGAGPEVVAIRRSTGTIEWRFADVQLVPLGEIAIATDGNLVAFAQGRGVATVLNAATGSVVWQRALLPDHKDNWISAPVFANGTLVYSRRPARPSPGASEQIAFAVRATTGDSLWTITVNHSQGRNEYGGIYSIPTLDGLILGTHDGLLISLRASDGAIRWQATSPSTAGQDERAMIQLGDDLIATSIVSPGRIQSLNVNTGRINWTVESPIGSPATGLGANTTSIAFTAFGGQLVIVSRLDGASRFIELRDLFPQHIDAGFLATPEFVGDRIVVSTSEGLLTLRPK